MASGAGPGVPGGYRGPFGRALRATLTHVRGVAGVMGSRRTGRSEVRDTAALHSSRARPTFLIAYAMAQTTVRPEVGAAAEADRDDLVDLWTAFKSVRQRLVHLVATDSAMGFLAQDSGAELSSPVSVRYSRVWLRRWH